MRLTTWNVNGIRNPFSYQPWSASKSFPAMFDLLGSDIVVMQELKIQRKDLKDDMVMLDGWDCYFSVPKQKKGYSGVGIYTRNATCAPIRAEEGITGVLTPPNSQTQYRNLPEDKQIGGYPSELQMIELGVDPVLLDSEGRCVCLEFPAFVLFGVYSPANSNGLRDEFRLGFLCALEYRIRNLIKMGKRVVLVGDLNVSRSEIDSASAIEELKKAGISHEEYISTPNRRIFNQMIINGEVVGERDEGREKAILMDVVRDYHPTRIGMYTHWEQKVNARPGNFGSRIDFVLASEEMQEWFVDANIQEGLMGSDHCPVFGDFKDRVPITQGDTVQEVNMLDIMSPPGVFINGIRQREWNVKEVPAFSAKLMPEFYQRRSIKDMFKKSSAPANPTPTPQDQPAVTTQTNTDLEVGEASLSRQAMLSPTKAAPSPSPDRKRKVSDAQPSQPPKKQKSNPAPASKAAPSKGQQSLKGFFQPKTKPSTTDKKNVTTAKSLNGTTSNGLEVDDGRADKETGSVAGDTSLQEDQDVSSTSPASTNAKVSSGKALADTKGSAISWQTHANPDPPPLLIEEDEMVYDPIENKESWQSLFRKKNVPLCEHDEPCKSMQTKKKGENQGRSFYMCARPLGPSGAKEKATEWRCSTFIWCSDWRGETK